MKIFQRGICKKANLISSVEFSLSLLIYTLIVTGNGGNPAKRTHHRKIVIWKKKPLKTHLLKKGRNDCDAPLLTEPFRADLLFSGLDTVAPGRPRCAVHRKPFDRHSDTSG